MWGPCTVRESGLEGVGSLLVASLHRRRGCMLGRTVA